MKGMILELGSGIWESLLTEGSKHGGVAFGFIIASAINYFFTRLAGKSCHSKSELLACNQSWQSLETSVVLPAKRLRR